MKKSGSTSIERSRDVGASRLLTPRYCGLYLEHHGKGIWQMKRPGAIISLTYLLGLLSFANLGEAGEGPAGKVDPAALKNQVVGQEAALSLESLTASKTFRDIPSISGNYTVKGTRIMPYVGAGFGHGYTS